MIIPRQYCDINGKPCTLNELCRTEPEWAAKQIHQRDELEIQLHETRTLMKQYREIAEFFRSTIYLTSDQWTEKIDELVQENITKLETLNKQTK